MRIIIKRRNGAIGWAEDIIVGTKSGSLGLVGCGWAGEETGRREYAEFRVTGDVDAVIRESRLDRFDWEMETGRVGTYVRVYMGEKYVKDPSRLNKNRVWRPRGNIRMSGFVVWEGEGVKWVEF